ncbi:hypothetical protein ASG37_12090 [Sphingomonas sp. Leaf407]|uniref:DUF2336 domain-containing protein n=1 Tax=unclassified Sphingomonas TaxID=196159 RepID=UPI0006F7BBDB|nr:MULTISPECIES: DUF2336 domain-containing protein [unclassified Sphingomonas]KQN37746.1 hypothetical protein ASE97_09380 [Sphingomonas sp. Leaf42]KQT28113.1 hypothetical protein ASG37_12090 [Sphingomonas sp. Leaf407]
MAYDPLDPLSPPAAISPLLDRVASAERVGASRLRAAADTFHLTDDARIDDRTATALHGAMRGVVGAVEAEVRDHAVRLLTTRGEAALAQQLRGCGGTFDRVNRAGLFRDGALFGELLARVRLAHIAAALPVTLPEGLERPTMIARMAQASDRLVAAAAVAMLAAQARRGPRWDGDVTVVDLVRPLHQRVAWWVAAALREAVAAGDATTLLDAALSESVRRALDPQAELVPLEVAAMRLAQAVDAQRDELPGLLIEAIGDGRLVFFVALLAKASGLAFARVRDLLIDRDGTRLWVVLRAVDLDRTVIARIGFALAEAEPARDVEALAEAIDSIMAFTPAAARLALAPMALDPDYHAAMLALGGQT